MKLKSMFLAASMLVLSAFAVAQTFSNNYFDASFVGAVTSATSRNNANTSTNYDFTASDTNIFQDIDVRLVDHDIAVGRLIEHDFGMAGGDDLRALPRRHLCQ